MKELDKVKIHWKSHLKESSSLISGEEVYFQKLLRLAKNSSKVLEIGVGKGRMVKVLKDHGVSAEFYGIDLTDNVYSSDTIAKVGDARALPYPDNTFDLVYSLGVIEHFPETYESVCEHARVVKRGGYVLVTTPHLSIFTPLMYLVYLIKDRSHGSFEEIIGRNIRLNTMKKYFEGAGLSISDCGVYGMYGIKRILRKLNLKIIQQVFQQKICIGAFLYVLGKKNECKHDDMNCKPC